MRHFFLAISCLTVSVVSTSAVWTEFRGPDGTGQYTGPEIVTEWGTDKNVTWKTEIPGKGWSSPIVSKEKIYLTTAIPKNGGQSLHALCVDAKTGKIDWNHEVLFADATAAGKQHSKNTFASPTPVTDGERLYVHFGHMGTACLKLNGEIVWKRTDYSYSPVHGTGGSPILAGGQLIFSVDGADQQYVVALDKTNGTEVWKTDRKSNASRKFSFTTPLVITSGEQKFIVSPASDFVAAYDLKTGAEVWRAKYPAGGYSLIARPVIADGRLIIQTGYNTPYLFALTPEGRGDISTNIKWSTKKGAPHTPTPVAFGNELYTVTDQGFLTCFDAKTGEVHWSERLAGKGYSSSPIIVNGKLYITSEDGTGQVIEASPEAFKPLTKSSMGEKTFATPAPVSGSLYLRTDTKLYRFDRGEN